jgi:hypothetical protein
MRRDQWLAEFAAKLEIEPPSKGEVKDLLDLAATAAHSSERTAAPLACWLAGRSDKGFEELLELAESIAPPSDEA